MKLSTTVDLFIQGAQDGGAATRNKGGRPRTITAQAAEIGSRIKTRREELGLQRSDLGAVIGITRAELAYLERQCGDSSQTKYLHKFASALVASELWLRTGEGDPPEPPVRVNRFEKLAGNSNNIDMKADARYAVELRKLLGERAKKRRNLIRLKLKDCAAFMGVPGPILSSMEHCLRSSSNAELEALWEEALKVPQGWLRKPEIRESDLPSQITVGGIEIEAGFERRSSPPQSLEIRQQLAARARARRQQLKKPVAVICEAIGKNKPAFAKNEICLRKFPEETVEALWERELQVPTGWLRDPTVETPQLLAPAADYTPVDPVPVGTWSTASAEIRAIAAWLSRKPRLRKTTDWDQLSPAEQRWAEIFAIRYGVKGPEAATLEAGGQRIGITRERIRQIVEKMASRAADLPVPSKQFDLLHQSVLKMAPASTSEIEEALRDLLGENLGLVDAQRFAAEILAKRVATFSTATGNPNKWSKDFVLLHDGSDDEPFLRNARSVSMSMIRACGAANIYHVCGVLSRELNQTIALQDVTQSVRRVAGFEWISERHGWFWFGEEVSDNRLVNVVKKVMAAAQRKVDVDEIHGAMGRSQRHLSHKKDSNNFFVEVPANILTLILQRVSWLSCIQKNDFIICNDEAIKGCLSDVENAVLSVIRGNDGVALKYEIDMHVKSELGVSDMGIAMALAKSPCFVQPARGLYSVCGCDINYQAMEKATLLAQGLHNTGTSGIADDDGWYRFDFELSEYHCKHKIIGLPSMLSKKLIPGHYMVNGRNERVEVVARSSGLTLLSKAMPIMHLLEVRPGDALTFEINPSTMLARFLKRHMPI